MIDRINISSVENRKFTPTKTGTTVPGQPSFGGIDGLVNGLIQGVQLCEKYPMVNVSALDLTSAIIPRTIVETKEANAVAGFEAFRRESLGLIVNCLLPSVIVMGIAKLLNKPVMKDFAGGKLYRSWANEDLLNKISEFYTSAKGGGKERTAATFRNMLNSLYGVDGSEMKAFKNFNLEPAVRKLTSAVHTEGKKAEIYRKAAYRYIVSQTGACENLKFSLKEGFSSSNLDSICRDTTNVLKGIVKENVPADRLAEFFKRGKKFINVKTAAGFAIVLPLALSMQYVNRLITRKVSNKKGNPMYKNFEKEEAKELTPKEKGQLFKNKILSVSAMLGVAWLSMMKMPNWKMFQFNGWFPSMDQARLISAATFAGRMASSEDSNDLISHTIRDITTFSSFYFLGDYAAKGIATAMEKKKGIKLLNRLKEAKPGANVMQKFWNWVKNVHLKSSDELLTKQAKKLRTYCQIGNLGFSLAILGLLVPLFTVKKANKNHERQYAGFSGSGDSNYNFNNEYVKNKSVAFKSFFGK